MGAYLDIPVKDKVSNDYENKYLKCGASSMQGWRVTQEDAHNCLLDYDTDASFFAVYDGHGGHEVAEYTSMNLPNFIKELETYKKGDYEEALKEAFLGFDAQLATEPVVEQLKEIAFSKSSDIADKKSGGNSNDDDDDDDDADCDEDDDMVKTLKKEAKMPLTELITFYATKGLAKKQKKAATTTTTNKEATDLLVSSSSGSGGSGDSQQPAGTSKKNNKSIENGEQQQQDEKKTTNEIETSTTSSSTNDNAVSSSTSSSTTTTTHINGEVNNENVDKNVTEMIEKPEIEQGHCSTDDSSITSSGAGERISKKRAVINMHRSLIEDGENDDDDDDDDDDSEETSNSDDDDDDDDDEEDESFHINEEQSCSSSKKSLKKKKKLKNGKNKGVKKSDGDGNDGTEGKQDAEEEDDEEDSDNNDDDDDDESESEEYCEDEYNNDDDDDDEDEEEEEDDEETESGCGSSSNTASNNSNRFIGSCKKEVPGSDSGCTAVVCLIHKDTIFVANAGDSRAVLCREGVAVDLSIDHKPDDEAEMKRIIGAGGEVTWEGRVNGGLNLSRALGDHLYKKATDLDATQQMITALPDIKIEKIDPLHDEFIILACDGIWNSMSSQEAVDFVRPLLNNGEKLSTICEKMFEKCVAPGMHFVLCDGSGSDNMTCIIVQLNKDIKDNNTKRQSDSPLKDDNETKKVKLDSLSEE